MSSEMRDPDGTSSGQSQIMYQAKVDDAGFDGLATDREYTTQLRGTRSGDSP